MSTQGNGKRSAHDQRGIALITVILLLLVLTALGMAASVLMTQEDRTSSRQEMQRAALYTAEAGLRRGEMYLGLINTGLLTQLLSHTAVAIQTWTGDPTSGSNLPSQPTLGDPTTWTIAHLGTYMVALDPTTSLPIDDGTGELVNQQVAYTGASGAGGMATKAFYTLYVRNNPEDLAAAVTDDTDLRLRLISVGFITSAGATPSGDTLTGSYQVLAVKVLEEEYNWSGVTQSPSVQKQVNAGGTGSILVDASAIQ